MNFAKATFEVSASVGKGIIVETLLVGKTTRDEKAGIKPTALEFMLISPRKMCHDLWCAADLPLTGKEKLTTLASV